MSNLGAGIPHSLLDLTYAWTRTHRPALRTVLARSVLHSRAAHSQSLAIRPPEAQCHERYPARSIRGRGDKRSTQISQQVNSRLTPVHILNRRVDALLEQPIAEYGTLDGPTYTEEDLQSVYADLLAHKTPQKLSPASVNAPITDHATLLQIAMSRIGIGVPTEELNATSSQITTGLGMALKDLQADIDSQSEVIDQPHLQRQMSVEYRPRHMQLLDWLSDAVANVEGANANRSGVSSSMRTEHFPVRLLADDEWKALVHACVDHGDYASCETTLDLALRNEPTLFSGILQFAVEKHSKLGDVSAVENLIGKFSNGKPCAHIRDMHIKAHLKSPIVNPVEGSVPNIERALSTLHGYESVSLAPPQCTYTRLVTALFRAHSTHCHAQAWDLFAHMRYVAHPKPDELMYALMIRACAGTGASQGVDVVEPERALDLWKELTADGSIPGVGAYNAVILACARSKKYAHEAFRLVKEMLDAHRDAFGKPLMRPDRDTFCALLEAAKRTGDLTKARWILAEMINWGKRSFDAGDVTDNAVVDGEIMMHILHAYAAYRPPFQRSATKVIGEMADASEGNAALENNASQQIEETNTRRFTAIPPQTHSEVVAEARTLFQHIIDNKKASKLEQEHNSAIPPNTFSNVDITSRLVNAYLSVHYAHSPLSTSHSLFKKLFSETGVKKTERTYVEVLERIARHEDTDEKNLALTFANELWAEWIGVEDGLKKFGHSARMIERAYTAMIKITVIYNDLSRSVALLRSFFHSYNPRSVRIPTPRPEMRSGRTQLFAHKPIVRLTTATEVPDDRVPPLLTFTDLAVLHQRLVQERRENDIAFLKYVCVSYECGLKKRRERALKV